MGALTPYYQWCTTYILGCFNPGLLNHCSLLWYTLGCWQHIPCKSAPYVCTCHSPHSRATHYSAYHCVQGVVAAVAAVVVEVVAGVVAAVVLVKAPPCRTTSPS